MGWRTPRRRDQVTQAKDSLRRVQQPGSGALTRQWVQAMDQFARVGGAVVSSADFFSGANVGRIRARRSRRPGAVACSVVSCAAIGVKAAIGKLAVPDDIYAHVVTPGVSGLGLSAR